jgi:hypothetical protein
MTQPLNGIIQIPIHLLSPLLKAYYEVTEANTKLVITKYRLHIALYNIWDHYIPLIQKYKIQPKCTEWTHVLQYILKWTSSMKQAKTNKHMKFIYQHSLELYSILWMKNTETSRFSTMKQGELCMNKWNEKVKQEEIMEEEKMIRFHIWIQEYCTSNLTSISSSTSVLVSTTSRLPHVSQDPIINEYGCVNIDNASNTVSTDLTTINDIHITDDDVTSLLSISSSVSCCTTNNDSKSEILDHHEIISTPASSSTSHNNVDINRRVIDSQATMEIDKYNDESITSATGNHFTTCEHKAEINKTSKHNSKLKSTSKCPLKSKHQLLTSKSEGSSTKHSTPASSSYDSLFDKSPYRNEQGIEKCVYCSDWFRPTDDSIISACGKITHAVHFTCWEQFYHQSHRTQRNKCPYGCHEHGVFVPVKLKWCGHIHSGIAGKRKLEEQDNSKCEVAIKRPHRTMNIEFNDPMAITFIEQMQSSDNESKQLFASFLQEYSSQLINHTSELSCGTAMLNVKGIPAMTIPTPGKTILRMSIRYDKVYYFMFLLCFFL